MVLVLLKAKERQCQTPAFIQRATFENGSFFAPACLLYLFLIFLYAAHCVSTIVIINIATLSFWKESREEGSNSFRLGALVHSF